MKKIPFLFAAAAALAGLLHAPCARAQDTVVDVSPMVNSGITATLVNMLRSQQRGRGRHKPHSHTGTTTAARGATRFTPDLALRKRSVSQVVAKARATNPNFGDELARAFAKDPIAAVAPALTRYGLKTNDVADAAAAYLVTAYYGARGSDEDAPQAQVRGLQMQLHQAFSSNRAFASASNAAKQQMAEGMLIQTLINDALIRGAKKAPDKMPSVKTAIRQGARETFQLDVTTMHLTSDGLRL